LFCPDVDGVTNDQQIAPASNRREESIMNTLAFTGDMARLQQAIAESHDLVVQRNTDLGALNLRTGERALELGCGGGYYAYEAARSVGPTGKICAIDISHDQIAAAQQRYAELAWVECREADIAAPPYGDGEFDVVFAVQALEYLADLDGALRHIHGTLRPGERVVIVATDWNSAVGCSEDPSRMQRVLVVWAPHTRCQSAWHPGSAAAPGRVPAAPADREPDRQHFL
jgi:ubiquinone/menaquinone biosynthesis C-methylase UbiE